MAANLVRVFLCNGAAAKDFERTSPGGGLRLVWREESAEARRFSRELGRDRPVRGRTIGTGEPFAIDAPSLHDRAERDFLAKCADYLNGEAERAAFERLIIAADPRALGRLRPLLKPAVAQRLQLVIDRDLTNLPTDKLIKALEKAAP